jgi:PEGA domain
MKKYIYLVLLLFLGLLISACDNTSTGPITGPTSGTIIVESEPTGAQIFLDNTSSSTGKVTNDSLTNVTFGDHFITLKLNGYRDTTVSTAISSDIPSAKIHVVLTSTESITMFGPVRIYETAGTTVDQPSGLDLSSGNAYGVSGADKDKVDIYYSTSGFLIQSASLNTTQGLTRETFFLVGNGTNLTDGESSSTYPIGGTWTNSIGDRESNYVFLYDDDSHYSKLKITNSGGGTGPGDPAWVEVTWIYNNTAIDTRF